MNSSAATRCAFVILYSILECILRHQEAIRCASLIVAWVQLKKAGHDNETDAWVVGADELTANSADIGAALYKALRDELLVIRQQSARESHRMKALSMLSA